MIIQINNIIYYSQFHKYQFNIANTNIKGYREEMRKEQISPHNNNQAHDFDLMPILSQNTFAKVYDNGQHVIKRIDLTKADKKDIQKVQNILEKMKINHHPNILKVENYSVTKDSKQLEIKTAKGHKNLSNIMKSTKFSEQQARSIMLQIIEGYQQLKELKISVEKIKPSNILLFNNQSKQIKIADYGLFQILKHKGRFESVNEQQIKVEEQIYNSPQCYVNGVSQQKNIVWGLGVLFYKLISGCPPWKNFKQFFEKYKQNKHKFQLIKLTQLTFTFISNAMSPEKDRCSINALLNLIKQHNFQNKALIECPDRKNLEIPQYYELKDKIGEGAYGQVFRCGGYAVKVIDFQKMESKQKQVMQDQPQRLIKIKHKNIAELYQFFYDKNKPSKLYMVMELCDTSLQQMLASAPNHNLNEKKAVQIFKQILSGYKKLRSLNLVHRDLKSANILISNNVVKLIDFGYSKQVENFDNSLLTTIVGTGPYKSPQLLGFKSYTTKSQIWALGIIFYQMLFGKRPFQGLSHWQLLQTMKDKTLQFLDTVQVSNQNKQKLKRMLQIDVQTRISWDQLFLEFRIYEQTQIQQDATENKTDVDINENNLNKRKNKQNQQKINLNKISNENFRIKQKYGDLKMTKQQKTKIDCQNKMQNCNKQGSLQQLKYLCKSIRDSFQKCFNKKYCCSKLCKNIKPKCFRSSTIQISLTQQQLEEIIKLHIYQTYNSDISQTINKEIQNRSFQNLNKQNMECLQNSIQFFNPSMQNALKNALQL